MSACIQEAYLADTVLKYKYIIFKAGDKDEETSTSFAHCMNFLTSMQLVWGGRKGNR